MTPLDQETRNFLPQSDAPSFQDLLSRLAAEHWRIIDELQAEVAQLNMRLEKWQIGNGGSAPDDFHALPAPEEGTIRSPRGARGRGREGVRAEYSSPQQGTGALRLPSSAKRVLEWRPTEFQSGEQMQSVHTLPVKGSRWRSRSRLPRVLKQLDLQTMLRDSVSSHGKAPDNAALGRACAIAQAVEDADDLESVSSSSAPIWQEPGYEGLDNRSSRNSRDVSIMSAVYEDDDTTPQYESMMSNGASPGDPETEVKLTVIEHGPIDLQQDATNGSATASTSGTSSRQQNVHLTLHNAWKTVLECGPELTGIGVSSHITHEESCSTDVTHMSSRSGPLKRQLQKGKSMKNSGERNNILNRLVVHPNNRWRVSWDLLGFLLLLWDLTSIPLQVFKVGTNGFSGKFQSFMHICAVFSTIFWTVDLIVNFFTGFYSAQGYLRMEFWLVVERYGKTWFLMDTVLAVTDWVTLCLGILAGSDIMRIGKTVARFLRIVRLLRFVKLSSALQDMLDRINSEYIVTLVGVAKILVFIIIMNHYIACGWYGLSQMPSATRTWLDRALIDTPHEHKKIPYMYFTSLHWSLTQFTPASMEVVPQNAFERGYNVVIIVIGVVAFSSFVSSITGAMTYIRIMNSRKTEQNACLRRFFTERNISQDMASRVWHWSQNTRSARIFKESDVQVLNLLPDRTRRDLRYELHAPILQAHPVFYLYHCLDLLTFRQICDSAAQEVSLKPGQNVFGESMHVDKMFFVLYGSVDYHQNKMNIRETRRLSTRSSQAVGKIASGSWACEVALWTSHARMSGEFIGGLSGLYGAELMVMKNHDFLEAVKANRQSMIYLSQYAALFVAECCSDRQMSKNAPYLFFNDLDELQEVAQRALDNLTALQKSAIVEKIDIQIGFEEFNASRARKTRMSTWRMPSFSARK